MLLEVRNLTVEFSNEGNKITAIDGISFSIEQGEILGIAGASGAGKSVTALAIMQLISKQNGVILKGEINYHHNKSSINLLKLSSDEICHFRGKEIGMVFQEPMTSLNPVIRCGAQVSETIALHRQCSKMESKAQTINLFSQVELSDPERIYNAYPFQLSGGEKQRIMIAMAISCNPKILIADEPTTSLDSLVQRSIVNLLKKMQSETLMSILYITHDLGLIAELTDRVLIMRKGKIVEEGITKNVLNNPKDKYTQGLISCLPLNYQKGKRLNVFTDLDNIESIPVINQNNAYSKFENKHNINPEFDPRSTPILKVESLNTSFINRKGIFGNKTKEKIVLDQASFEVMTGATFGIIGESGSGKTTLAKSILRLIEPKSGKVVFKGLSVTDSDKFDLREVRKKIQIIFQDPYASLNPCITIGEAIIEPMLVHKLFPDKGKCHNKVIELLEKVGLSEKYYKRKPNALSGGERQRAVIARALSLNPELLICDECVSALDVAVQAQILNLLNDLKYEFNLTYIFISHDLNVIKYMSDNLIVMHNGKIIEQGTAAEVFANPQSIYTKLLIEATPFINGSVKANG